MGSSGRRREELQEVKGVKEFKVKKAKIQEAKERKKIRLFFHRSANVFLSVNLSLYIPNLSIYLIFAFFPT